jgi:signal transduction histidine kinase
MPSAHRDAYKSWLIGEILLVGLLGAALALFVSNSTLRSAWELPQLRLVLDTAVAVASALVAVLAGIRFTVEGRRLDLLLCAGFATGAAGTAAFSIGPVLGGQSLHRSEVWTGLAAQVAAGALIAAAAFAPGRVARRTLALRTVIGGCAVLLGCLYACSRSLASALPSLAPLGSSRPSFGLTGLLAAQALLSLVAGVGFGLRFRAHRHDFDSWLALGATLALFADLHYVFTPLLRSAEVSQGDFLRLLSYGVLLAGVWNAIGHAHFGQAVADERARVAREIHDGLAQYLFAISTHVSMLEHGADPAAALPRLREAASAAQQEARFAVLALSSASGSAPFDAALRRYVDVLTADGALDVELDIEDDVQLAPDEQIEVFRIVQEGLANARKHAGARRADVRIGRRAGQRFVSVRDDGSGFDEDEAAPGQGLKNLRARTATIGGGFSLRSRPGGGTALEVTLRP